MNPIALPFPILALATDASSANLVLDCIRYGFVALLAGAAIIVAIRDIIRLSVSRLWALAMQTFRESVRRRVLLLIPGAMALIVVIGLFHHAPASAAQSLQDVGFQVGELHQDIGLCITTSSALTLLLMILLSAFAFPREIESRTIYSLLTKPVTRLEVFLGKTLGLWMVAGVILAAMGLFSLGYLNVRAAHLTGEARRELAEQQVRYDRYQAQQRATSQPDIRGLNPRVARPADAVPPDATLAEQLDLGLLRSANYVDPQHIRIRPLPPDDLAGRHREWMLTGRGYIGLYVFDLPEGSVSPTGYHIDFRLDIPRLSNDDPVSPRAQVQLFITDLPADAQIQTGTPPRAIQFAGWKVALTEPMQANLNHTPDGLWAGSIELAGNMQSLAKVSQLAVSIEPVVNANRLVGLVPPAAAGAAAEEPGMFLRAYTGLAMRIFPSRLFVFPRSQAMQRFPVSGTPRGFQHEFKAEVAEYTFDDIPLDRLPPGDLVFRLDFTVDKGSSLSVDTRAVVTAISPSGRSEEQFVIPSTRMGCFVRVKRDLVENGRLTLHVRPELADDSFTLSARSVRLEGPTAPFAVNLFKSLLVSMLEAMMVVAMGVMASVFLSWPVALLFTAVLLIAGNLLGMVRGMLTMPGGMNVFTVRGEDKSLDMLSQAGNVFFRESSRAMDKLIPDFTRFDPQAFISQGLAIPWAMLGDNALWAAAYLGVALAVGYLTLHFKEVAR